MTKWYKASVHKDWFLLCLSKKSKLQILLRLLGEEDDWSLKHMTYKEYKKFKKEEYK